MLTRHYRKPLRGVAKREGKQTKRGSRKAAPFFCLSVHQSLALSSTGACADDCMYHADVALEWDDDKAALNFAKHGVAFSEVAAVFEDDLAITMTNHDGDPLESRFIALGIGAKANLLVVVYCCRGPNIRIISARKANKAESSQCGGEA